MKSTMQLMEEIQKAEDIAIYLKENEELIQQMELSNYLETMLEKHNKRRKEVIYSSGISITYGYQIFKGMKQPTRDKIIQVAMGFPLTLEELQKALQYGGVNELYPYYKRDAIIIFALYRGLSVEELNVLLEQNNEKMFEMFC